MQKNASSPLSLKLRTPETPVLSSPMNIFADFDSVSSSLAQAIDRHLQYSNSLAVQDRQEMINRHSLCLSRLCRASEEATSLRRENDTLRSLNVEMTEKLRLLIHSSLAQSRLGREKIGPSSAGLGRFLLPKSISVKSDEYLNTARSSRDNGERALKNNKQKVYVRREKSHEEERLRVEVKKQGSLKTELCNKWQETGECPYGAHCQFAHGVEELRPVIRHPRYKTEVCRMVLAGVACPYGHRCHFRHAVAAHDKPCRPVSLINS